MTLKASTQNWPLSNPPIVHGPKRGLTSQASNQMNENIFTYSSRVCGKSNGKGHECIILLQEGSKELGIIIQSLTFLKPEPCYKLT